MSKPRVVTTFSGTLEIGITLVLAGSLSLSAEAGTTECLQFAPGGWLADCGFATVGQPAIGTLVATNVVAELGLIGCLEFIVPAVLGDLDGDGCVDGSDLGILLADWGAEANPSPADLDGSGGVDGGDLGILLSQWGCMPFESMNFCGTG